QIANDNCPGQVVISGNISALERAIVLAKEAGARKAIKLAVSIAAHSELMSSAQSEFTNAIENSGIIAPNIPIIGNVSAEPLNSITDIYSELNAQLTSRVRWTESIMYLVDQGISTIIEIGTGNVLSGLIKRIDRNITRLSLGTPQDFDKLATLI
ncbi:MAG: ACP S-malonyltransferase, partial [Chloroflexota bacterium]